MSAALWACRGRGVVVVLASGAVISLSALTAGMTPALADPADAPPTTPVSPPVPAVQAPPRVVAAPNIPPPPPPPPPAAPRPVAPPPPPAPRPVPPPPEAPRSVESPPPLAATTPAPEITKPVAPPTTPAPVHTAPPVPPTTAAAPPITTTVPAAPRATSAPPALPPPVSTAQSAPAVVPRTQPAPAVTGIAPQTALAPPSAAIAAQSPPGPSGQQPGPPPGTGIPAPAGESPAPRTPLAPRGAANSPAAVSSASSPVLTAGQVMTIHQADKLQAPQQNVDLSKASVPAEYRPTPAAPADIDGLRNKVGSPGTEDTGQNRDGHDPGAPDPGRPGSDQHEWDHRVRQWDRDWVSYDEDWRPVICNPYQDTLQVVYYYQDAPQIVVIPPLASAVLDVADYGAYDFTALLTGAVGQAVDVAVGSFFGGGYYPGPDLPPPPPPPPVVTYDNVPVAVDYPDATYEPFVASQVVDVGDDPQYGEHKVLLDGATPVWGQWSQTPDGQRQFEVHKTQQFPGLDVPQPGPLPGNYQLQLANKQSKAAPGMPARDVFVIAASAAVATFGLCAAVAFVVVRRRPRALR